MRSLGFEGPFSGTRHHFLVLGHHRLAIPSNEEYPVPQLRMVLREVEEILQRRITADDWDKL
jgi:hypothetical protein